MNRLARWTALLGALALTRCTMGIAVCDGDSECGAGSSCDLQTHICVVGVGGTGGGGVTQGVGGGTGGGGSTEGVGGGTGGGGVGGGGSGGGVGGSGGVGGGGVGVGGGSGGGAASVSLALLIPAPPARPAAGNTVYEDSPKAWLRTESVYLWLQAAGNVTNPGVQVAGTSGGAMDATAVAASKCAGTCAGSCTCFRIDCWKPPLADLRGTFVVTGSGSSAGDRVVSAPVSLPVTRLHWSRALGSGVQVHATPAIGSNGTIYVGTNGGPTIGNLIAIASTGLEKWNQALGRIDASPAISGTRIFVGAVEAIGGRLLAYDTQGAVVAQCGLLPGTTLEASPAILTGGAAFQVNGLRGLVAIRPGNALPCTPIGVLGEVGFPGNLVATGQTVYLLDSTPALRRFDLGEDDGKKDKKLVSWKERTSGGWPGLLPPGYRNNGLALGPATKLYGAGELGSGGAVFQATVGSDLKFDYGFSPPRMVPAAQGPVVTSTGLVLVGISTGGIAASSATGIQSAGGDRIRNSPALGEGGRLYALSENGAISEWSYASGTPARSWSAALDSAFDASPALDCARDDTGKIIAGLPGTLYAVSRAGILYSVIVDARGVDTTARWPKYQRDPANSGNADQSLNDFKCP